MGGCVSGCMSSSDKSAQVPNKHAEATAKIEAFSVETDAEVAPNEGKIRRSPSQAKLAYQEWWDQYYGSKWGSLPALLKETCAKHGEKKAQGWRPVDKMVDEETDMPDGSKKTLGITYYNETQTITFNQMWERCVGFGNGLKALGLEPESKVGLYEETRAEWLQACFGIWIGGMVGVTVYANLGEDALLYAMKESELPVILLNGKQVPKLRKLCAEGNVSVPILIYTDSLPAGTDAEGAYSFDEVVAKGSGQELPDFHTDPNKHALIMYTSGTTGDPKGVIMSHGNLIAAILGFERRLEDSMALEPGVPFEGEDEVYVAYLPLAHSLEFAAENVMMMRGVMVGYGNPRTLTNTAARPHGDLVEFKPSFFAGVPRIFDTIKKAVIAKLPEGGVKRAVFDRAVEDRKVAMQNCMETPYWNEKVFKNPRELLGGRVRAIASGAAPLSEQTQVFMEVVFGVSIMQGYGLTETCACTTLQRMYDTRKESIGGLLSVVEVKLRDADVWKHTDTPARGEVLIRGPVVTQGYYKQPEKTAEAYQDGWFCTGDVAEIPSDGTLKIIGRTKALAKNLNGEYIALEALESTYVQNDLVLPNGICVVVHPQHSYIGAVLLTDQPKAMKFAKEHSIEGEWPQILQSDAFRKKVAQSLAATASDFGRKPFERVKHVRIFDHEWTPENDVLTAAMKLKRRVIDERYKEAIEEIFSEAS